MVAAVWLCRGVDQNWQQDKALKEVYVPLHGLESRKGVSGQLVLQNLLIDRAKEGTLEISLAAGRVSVLFLFFLILNTTQSILRQAGVKTATATAAHLQGVRSRERG